MTQAAGWKERPLTFPGHARLLSLWGLNIGFCAWPAGLWCPVRSCGEVILVGEPAEDWPAAHLVLGEVDHWWELGFDLGWCELPECAVWPRGVEMMEVDRQDPVGFQNSATAVDLDFQAARSYSLIKPPRTGLRVIRSCLRSATG